MILGAIFTRTMQTKLIMSYEIPAGTTPIINRSKLIAQQYNLLHVNSLCLLLSILESEYIVALLKKIGVSKKSLMSSINSILNTEISANDQSKFEMDTDSESIALDEDCTRIIKLLTLEDKLAQGKKSAAELLLLALLHDRSNEAKKC